MMKKADLKGTKKIDSPLAKYNSVGQLFCVLCNQSVKNEMVWTAHINGRIHRDNLQQLKGKKRPQDTNTETFTPPSKKLAIEASASQFKAPLPVASSSAAVIQFKTPAPVPLRTSSAIPSTSRNSVQILPPSNSKTSKPEKVEDNEKQVESQAQNGMETESNQEVVEPTTKSKPNSLSNGTVLPEGFFDDPKLDAKVRGQEYRDPEEIEWDNFVKEIASEELKSSSMRVVDEEESTVNRELDEIEEQMTHWKRVLDLEQKAKDLKSCKSVLLKRIVQEEEMDEDEEYDNELDWRSKRH